MRLFIGYFLILSIIATSCKDNSIAAKIYNECGKQDTCIRLVKDVTNFKWDKVFIFSVGTGLEEIEKVIGVPYREWQDVGDRIIFIDIEKVVYHEEYFPYPEQFENGTTFFELNETPYIGQYQTATFSVTKRKKENKEWYYIVTPIQ